MTIAIGYSKDYRRVVYPTANNTATSELISHDSEVNKHILTIALTWALVTM